MIERIFKTGHRPPLHGVQTGPDSSAPSGPAVLLLNSGVLHHPGPCRLSVRIARCLGDQGFLVVRFDGAGIGDSEARGSRGSATQREVAVAEVAEVMDTIAETNGIRTFILFGLCSGAHTSFFAACRDPRIVGIAMIDPFAYKTWRYHLNYFLPRVSNAGAWSRLLRRQALALARRVGGMAVVASGEANAARFVEVPELFEQPSRGEVAQDLRRLVARRTRILVCFTGGTLNYNYASQYRDSFRDVEFQDLLTLRHLPEANHIVTQLDAQAAIVRDVSEWVCASRAVSFDPPT